MNTILNVKKVSLLFFLVLTGTHIFSSIMLTKGYSNQTILLLNETLDIPTILSGLIYAFTSLRIYREQLQKSTHWFDIVAGLIAGIILALTLYFNFFFTSAS
ncbi:MAG: hypothetical protein UT55_C0023G0008 [Candidatus Peregrinibacteria bacterium GW2011_GWE2_39_6]|nr:MAG: hypothetical protein UT36_C0013G0013 [Candidatus Peregrinibacteria bacterium GW2011_GWF2_39_17]KKR25962.1 MAG: hypothetical protein UT55_C0023G0008 [Candidatus Peregrinibacteria bacterium GW2011_GWE2_39_6]HCW32459.1 hypothetical protein [Candidatus Peregrinibacteria bacterium]